MYISTNVCKMQCSTCTESIHNFIMSSDGTILENVWLFPQLVIIITGGDIRFLPLGSASVSLPPDDDSISEAISPPGGFRAFGTNYSDLYVCRYHTYSSTVYIGMAQVVGSIYSWFSVNIIKDVYTKRIIGPF